MKTDITPAMQDHLESGQLTLAYGCKIERTDGEVFGFTNHDDDADIGGVTYKARTGIYRNALTNTEKYNVDNLELVGFLDSDAITDDDIRAGLYRDAKVHHFLYNWADLSDEMGIIKLPGSGWMGEITLNTPTGYKAQTLGLMQAYQPNHGDLYSPNCRYDLGDASCTKDLTTFKRQGAVTGIVDEFHEFTADATGDPFDTTTQLQVPSWKAKHHYYPGEAMLLGRDSVYFYVCEAANSYAEGNLPTSGGTAPQPATTEGELITDDDIVWRSVLYHVYLDGRIHWLTGDNVKFPGQIIEYIETPTSFSLMDGTPYPIQEGDTFEVEPGCNKQFYVCSAFFSNQLNFGGEPHTPGQDAYLDTPDKDG